MQVIGTDGCKLVVKRKVAVFLMYLFIIFKVDFSTFYWRSNYFSEVLVFDVFTALRAYQMSVSVSCNIFVIQHRWIKDGMSLMMKSINVLLVSDNYDTDLLITLTDTQLLLLGLLLLLLLQL